MNKYVTLTLEQYNYLSNIVSDLDDIVIIHPWNDLNYYKMSYGNMFLIPYLKVQI